MRLTLQLFASAQMLHRTPVRYIWNVQHELLHHATEEVAIEFLAYSSGLSYCTSKLLVVSLALPCKEVHSWTVIVPAQLRVLEKPVCRCIVWPQNKLGLDKEQANNVFSRLV
jgi:hypothetical protein